jgi:hypothetical protein
MKYDVHSSNIAKWIGQVPGKYIQKPDYNKTEMCWLGVGLFNNKTINISTLHFQVFKCYVWAGTNHFLLTILKPIKISHPILCLAYICEKIITYIFCRCLLCSLLLC